MKVTSDFFTGERITARRPTVVLFYSNNCGHCHNFLPTWQRFEHSATINTAALEMSTANRQLVSQLSRTLVKGVPTIILYRDGAPYKEYRGNRSYEDLVKFANIGGTPSFEKVGR